MEHRKETGWKYTEIVVLQKPESKAVIFLSTL